MLGELCETNVEKSRVAWECNSKEGVSWLLRLNIGATPIAHKYCEGKVKRTLKREWKEHEIAVKGTWSNLWECCCGRFSVYAIYTCVTATKQTHNISLLSDSERKCSVEILGAPRVRAGLTYYYLMICKTERNCFTCLYRKVLFQRFGAIDAWRLDSSPLQPGFLGWMGFWEFSCVGRIGRESTKVRS